MLAVTNREVIQSDRDGALDLDVRDSGRGRWLRFQVLNKRLQPPLGAFEINFNSLFAVQHPTRERVGARQMIHVRTEADALYHSTHSNGAGLGHVYSAPTMQPWPCHPI